MKIPLGNIRQLAFEYSDLNRAFWAVESNGGCNQTRGADLHSFALRVFLKRNFAVGAVGGATTIPKNLSGTQKNPPHSIQNTVMSRGDVLD